MASLRVLVVEDHDDSREMLCELLGLFGATVQAASSVREALVQLESSVPDVILSDLGMADEDGCELARHLQEHPNRKAMRLVAVTGFSSPTDHEHARQAGFDVILVKPVKPDEIEALLQEPGGIRG